MSIKLMSAIFETEMHDLEYTKGGETRKAKASTAKLLLLAIADHANDYGESAYPGYDRLEIKTALSRQGIADTLDALKQNGIIFVKDTPSRLQTNDYTINAQSFPSMLEKCESSHLTSTSQATGLGRVKPLDPNHQLTINQPSTTTAKTAETFTAYEAEIGALTPTISEQIGAALDDKRLGSGWVIDAIQEAARQNKRSWAYISAILNRWATEGKQARVKLPSGPKYPRKPNQADNLQAIQDGVKLYEEMHANGNI